MPSLCLFTPHSHASCPLAWAVWKHRPHRLRGLFMRSNESASQPFQETFTAVAFIKTSLVPNNRNHCSLPKQRGEFKDPVLTPRPKGRDPRTEVRQGDPEGLLSSSLPLLLSTSDPFSPSLRPASYASCSSLGWRLPHSYTAPQKELISLSLLSPCLPLSQSQFKILGQASVCSGLGSMLVWKRECQDR